MQMLVDQELARVRRAGDLRVLMAAPDAAARTAYRKSHYPFRLSSEGHGLNPDSWKPFAFARRLFFVCGKRDCTALVQANNAYKAARAKGRTKLRPGDGCACCCARGRQRNPGRFAKYQRAFAAAIAVGDYFLIRRPKKVRPKSVILVNSADLDACVCRSYYPVRLLRDPTLTPEEHKRVQW